MITLRELVKQQDLIGGSDIQVIKAFFTLNDLEEDGINLISELTKEKITKIKNEFLMAKTWTCVLPSKYLYEKYDLDTADKLFHLELNFLINNGELTNDYMEWAKENVPKIKHPGTYFRPLIEYMEENGINFK